MQIHRAIPTQLELYSYKSYITEIHRLAFHVLHFIFNVAQIRIIRIWLCIGFEWDQTNADFDSEII